MREDGDGAGYVHLGDDVDVAGEPHGHHLAAGDAVLHQAAAVAAASASRPATKTAAARSASLATRGRADAARSTIRITAASSVASPAAVTLTPRGRSRVTEPASPRSPAPPACGPLPHGGLERGCRGRPVGDDQHALR